MPLKLDSVDAAILQALSVDGRKSLRQLVREVNISAPTVDARLKRIMQARTLKIQSRNPNLIQARANPCDTCDSSEYGQ